MIIFSIEYICCATRDMIRQCQSFGTYWLPQGKSRVNVCGGVEGFEEMKGLFIFREEEQFVCD
jgi:hypothetical protein